MVSVELAAIRLDAKDPERVAVFWAEVLRRPIQPLPRGSVAVTPTGLPAYPLEVVPADTPKRGQNRIHLDLTSTSEDDQAGTVARGLAAGGQPADVGQGSEELHVVLADPEGNELCVIEPGNGFLAGTGDIGAINCDGTRAVGHFWSTVLGWPLVWDQDEETAIEAPGGGSKITWSGPPLMPRHGRERWRLVLSTADPLPDVVAWLGSLGAQPADASGPSGGSAGTDETTLLDPDGNEFHLLTRGEDLP